MKKIMMLVTLCTALLVLVIGASANTAARLRVDVPFAFYVDKELLQPGKYIIEMRPISPHSASSSSVVVRNLDGTIATWISTMPGAAFRSMGDNHLHFSRYGNQYFLSKVECLEHQADLRKSRAEKELMAQVKAKDTTLVAQD